MPLPQIHTPPEIQSIFAESWNKPTEYFVHYSHTSNALPMLNIWREQGWDKHLRAGNSLTSFVLSRARNHGLKAYNSYIRLETDLYLGYLHTLPILQDFLQNPDYEADWEDIRKNINQGPPRVLNVEVFIKGKMRQLKLEMETLHEALVPALEELADIPVE